VTVSFAEMLNQQKTVFYFFCCCHSNVWHLSQHPGSF